MRSPLLLVALIGCAGTPEPRAVAPRAEVLAFRQVVPGAGLPAGVSPQDANNNLDIAWHDGRLFLAFRTAPTHFASPDTEMVVVSTTDEQSWRAEGRFTLDTDVREPQLVSWDGQLLLYFAVLGDNALDFEPQGMVHARYLGPDSWSDLTWHDDPTFIPWRIKELGGALHLVGYSGGGEIYEPGGEPIEISWFTSANGETWVPALPQGPVVQRGGGSETDFVILDDGALVAVTRNEAGDAFGFGSKICRAEADDLATWRCEADLRKFDSPLLFRRAGRIWLVARRNVTETGAYDLQREDLDRADQFLAYQVAYWNEPKRCSVWTVDPDRLTVTHVQDLPSRGDTCFPEAVERDGELLLYNYSSDPEGPDLSWLEGQTRPTGIYRMVLALDPEAPRTASARSRPGR